MKNTRKRIIIAILVICAVIAGAAIFTENAYFLPILMYHSVDINNKMTELSISPGSFERQMEFLHKNNYNVISLSEAVDYIKNRRRPPSRTVAITLDDGYYNNYQYAYPVLKRYGIKATLFIIIDKIGQSGWVGWKELKEMSDSGVITIGSHTKTHPWLTSLSAEGIKNEFDVSRMILEEKLGKKIDLLCYPMGEYDRRSQDIASRSGYICAVGTNPGRSSSVRDIYAIGRVKISRSSDNLLVFWFETTGYYKYFKWGMRR
jgi:peptidoglycan/xylan/chitin deacetylase (PgdA/CDA1 family)